ncbi:MAG: carbon-nitrogen hydrolase family protein [Bacteroidetes bacterium]|nr:MAG: carbon-nitrogen hydrolase family protein [Bacteroidota bacterium]RLE02251.1 MAG: carbon-nitrogen hydrolase family protein [Bacteroidota bacterium]
MKRLLCYILLVTIGIITPVVCHSQEELKPFTLAVAQMHVVGGALDANLEHAGEMIAEAAEHGAQLVLLPEAMDLGWTDPSALTMAEPVPGGKSTQLLSSMAKKYQIYICSGLTEKDGEKVYNSAVLIDPTGEVILLHRKINELDIGHAYYALGQSLQVVQTDLGSIGVMICADASTGKREIPRALSYMGADVILSPSAWAVPADHNKIDNPYGGTWWRAYKPVAKDFRVWIASCSNVGWMTGGPWKGWKAIGCSMVIGPDGNEVLNAPYGENADTILYVDIKPEPRPGQGTTWHNFWKKQD